MRWWVVAIFGVASCKASSQPVSVASHLTSAASADSEELPLVDNGPPIVDLDCAKALPTTIADECDLEGRALLKIDVVNGVSRSVKIFLTVDRPATAACLRKRALAAHYKNSPGASQCVLTFHVPDQDITWLEPMPGEKTPWLAEPWAPKLAPKPPSASTGPQFDKTAAKASLSSIAYRDCGDGGSGKVMLTFRNSGSVDAVLVTAGQYEPVTRRCIEKRFHRAKVPPFGGEPKTVAWSINLE